MIANWTRTEKATARNKPGHPTFVVIRPNIEEAPMTALILSLPEWTVIVGMIGLVAAMVYILFGNFSGRRKE